MIAWGIWLAWAFVCAFSIRLLVVALLKSRGPLSRHVAAYAIWILLLVLGFAIVGLSGFELYGYDQTDPLQFAGYVTLFFSPLGLPTLAGAPMVLFIDVLRALRPKTTAAQ